MLKAVIFDIDNTLYSFDDANRVATAATAAYAQRELELSSETFLASCRDAMYQQFREHGNSSGCHSRSLRYMMVLQKHHLPLFHAPILSDLYWAELLRVIVPFPGAKEQLSELKAHGIRLGVGTDMTADWQLKKLDRLGLLVLMDFIVTSEEAEAEKPSQPFFDLVLKKAGCAPEECLFIGDHLQKDVLGAQSAGMNALWYQPDPVKAAEQPLVKSIPGYHGLIDHIIQN
ncbi:MAG: HAD family hydrolase [Oscillospiraceae bacterium]|nr:HAD family hydrolase [Oscillospiraceae bacterium]